MKHYNNFNGLQMRTFVALVCGLFMSAIHAETMPSDAAVVSSATAASAVAAAPAAGEVVVSAVGATSGVAAIPAAGEVVVSAMGAASGVASVPAADEAAVSAVGAASGVAAVPAAGEVVVSAMGAASAVAAVPAAGEVTVSAIGAASEVAAVPAAGEAAASAVGAASAVAAVPTAGEAAASAVGAASEVAATPTVTAIPEAPVVALSPFEELLQLCAGCHNPDGNSVIPENPKLSGLGKKYIVRQLEDFKSGDRKNETMSAIIQAVDEDEFKNLAKYFSKQTRSTNVSDKPELVAQGQQIFEEGVIGTAAPACMGCHGEDGSGSRKFPRLNGQNALYVVNQMMDFKNGVRTNDARGLMRAVSKRLSDEDIVAVAEYMSTLKEIE